MTSLSYRIPKLNPAQIQRVILRVTEYIERQRQTYRPSAVALDPNKLAAMRPFFPASTLEAARLAVLARNWVSNPPFYGELTRMGFKVSSLPNFAFMTAITFVDTVVSHEPFTNSVLFHELVHVVQYQKLGLIEFAAKYVRASLMVALMKPSRWK